MEQHKILTKMHFGIESSYGHQLYFGSSLVHNKGF